MLMSFKLADMVNIAVEENNYFRSEAWCEINKGKMLVEHDQNDWEKRFFARYKELKGLEKKQDNQEEENTYSQHL